MSRKFATLRQQKTLTAEQFEAIRKHNERISKAKNVDSSKSHLNIYFKKRIYPTIESFAESKRMQIRSSNRKNGTKYRMVRRKINTTTKKKEYKAMSQEFVFSFSRGALNQEQALEYFKRINVFMNRWFPNIEVLSSVVHFDEMTPHLHYEVSYFNEVECRFVQDILMKQGLTNVDIIRDAIQDIADDFGLERQDGSVIGDRKHEAKADLKKMHTRELLENKLAESKEIIQTLKEQEPTTVKIENPINQKLEFENVILKAVLGSDIWEFSLEEFTIRANNIGLDVQQFLSMLEAQGLKIEVEDLNDVVTLAKQRNAHERSKNKSYEGAKNKLNL